MNKRGTICVYADSSSIFGFLIALFSGGKWTHDAISLGDGTAVQCSADHGGACILNEGQGMTTAKFAYPGDVEFVIGKLTSQVGKTRYDYANIADNPFWNIFKSAPKLKSGYRNCSTFVAEAMEADAHNPAAAYLWHKPLAAVTPTDIANAYEKWSLK